MPHKPFSNKQKNRQQPAFKLCCFSVHILKSLKKKRRKTHNKKTKIIATTEEYKCAPNSWVYEWLKQRKPTLVQIVNVPKKFTFQSGLFGSVKRAVYFAIDVSLSIIWKVIFLLRQKLVFTFENAHFHHIARHNHAELQQKRNARYFECLFLHFDYDCLSLFSCQLDAVNSKFILFLLHQCELVQLFCYNTFQRNEKVHKLVEAFWSRLPLLLLFFFCFSTFILKIQSATYIGINFIFLHLHLFIWCNW